MIQALHRKLLNVVPAKVENNAEISKNIFENYIIQREFIAPRQIIKATLRVIKQEIYLIFSNVA